MDDSTIMEIRNLRIDLYDRLGLTRTASASEIKKAFYKISSRMHPDKQVTVEEEELYKEVTLAYRILGNPQSRKLYDKEYTNHGIPRPLQHVIEDFTINVSIRTVFTGGKKGIRVSGFFKNSNGVLECQKKVLVLDIPKGIPDGTVILKIGWGGGGFSENGNKIIDLRIKVRYKEDPNFTIFGKNIFVKKEFTIKEAIIGGKKKVEMPDGTFEDIYIMETLKPGKILRFPNKGMPFRNGNQIVRGDLEVVCEIVFPEKVTLRDMELMGQTSF